MAQNVCRFNEKPYRSEVTESSRRNKERFESCRQLSIVSDGWTSDSHGSYYSTVVQYVDDDMNMKTPCLSFDYMDIPHTASNLVSVIEEAMEKVELGSDNGKAYKTRNKKVDLQFSLESIIKFSIYELTVHQAPPVLLRNSLNNLSSQPQLRIGKWRKRQYCSSNGTSYCEDVFSQNKKSNILSEADRYIAIPKVSMDNVLEWRKLTQE